VWLVRGEREREEMKVAAVGRESIDAIDSYFRIL
jgi:hypothetical protein